MSAKISYIKMSHVGGTKWYGILRVHTLNANFYVTMYGANGRVGGCKFEALARAVDVRIAAENIYVSKLKRGYYDTYNLETNHNPGDILDMTMNDATLTAGRKSDQFFHYWREHVLGLIAPAPMKSTHTSPAFSDAMLAMENFGDW